VEQATNTISSDPILVDFGLQGGGSHGAFTWGILDCLLEEPWLEIGQCLGAVEVEASEYRSWLAA
jgi:predicted patatin/cPLA2 family phospholipase